MDFSVWNAPWKARIIRSISFVFSIFLERINGFKIIIYANHMMRASYPAMINTAKEILNYGRSYESEKNLSSINEVINLIKT